MNVATDVSRMVDRAAKCSHPAGNRRYHHWIFQVTAENVVDGMTDARDGRSSRLFEDKPERPVPVLRAGEFLTYDECEACAGRGCRACDGRGEVMVIRREPSAQKPRKFGVMT